MKAGGIVILRSAEREDYLGLGRAMHQAYTYTTLKPSLLPTPYPTFLPPTPRPHSDLDSFQKTSSCSSSLIPPNGNNIWDSPDSAKEGTLRQILDLIRLDHLFAAHTNPRDL